MTTISRIVLLLTVVSCFVTAALGQTKNAQTKPAAKAAASPFDTKAVVEIKVDEKAVPLKREEQIAFMFINAIHELEKNCESGSTEPCTLEALIRAPKKKGDFGVGKLKFDPNASDPNYAYKLTLKGADWEVWATPKKPGFCSFYAKGKFFGGIYYRAEGGTASASDKEIRESSVSGDLFYEMFVGS